MKDGLLKSHYLSELIGRQAAKLNKLDMLPQKCFQILIRNKTLNF